MVNKTSIKEELYYSLILAEFFVMTLVIGCTVSELQSVPPISESQSLISIVQDRMVLLGLSCLVFAWLARNFEAINSLRLLNQYKAKMSEMDRRY